MTKKIVIFESIVLLLLLQFNTLLQANEPPINIQNVIASVNGEPIIYKDIRVSKENAIEIFKLEYKREPTTDDLNSTIKKMEQYKLNGKIQSHIRKNIIDKLGITATKEEARAYMREKYPGMKDNPNGVIERERHYFQQLTLALREVLKNHNNEKNIYESRLKDLMSYETWKLSQKHYNTIQKIELIEKNIPSSVDDIYKSGELTMGEMVIEEKLNDWITKDIKLSEEELKKYYDSRYKSNESDFKKLKPKIKNELFTIKRNSHIKKWWQEQYEKAKIEIKDKHFVGIGAASN